MSTFLQNNNSVLIPREFLFIHSLYVVLYVTHKKVKSQIISVE